MTLGLERSTAAQRGPSTDASADGRTGGWDSSLSSSSSLRSGDECHVWFKVGFRPQTLGPGLLKLGLLRFRAILVFVLYLKLASSFRNLGRVPRSDQSRRIPVPWACCPGVGAVAAFAGMARARDRSSLHAVRKENNGRKSWFRVSTVSFNC